MYATRGVESGRRHTAARRARRAKGDVDDADVRLAAINADGASVKQHFEEFQIEAMNLAGLAHPSPGGFALDELDREDMGQIDRLENAVDLWTRWAAGQPVRATELAAAVEVLTDSARQAPLLALHPGQVTRSQWTELLEPVTDLLRQRGIEEAPPDRDPTRRRTAPEVGIEL
jgi:hypothetical protein